MTDLTFENNNDKNKTKKVRRAFSMPRNPFRWSRKFKANKDDNRKIVENSSGNFVRTICDHTSNNMQFDGETSEMQINSNQKHNRSENITINANRVLRRSSFRKFLSRIAQHVTSVNFGAKHASPTNNQDRVPPLGGYQWPADQTPGVTGLKNHGNTCFMNAVLQCLSHTDILAEYFVLDQYKADLKRRNKLNSRKFGTKGELTEQLANVLKALWTCKNESDHSTSFKAVVDRYGSQFHSSTQHDAQEFLFWLLDKVHEDLNTATKRRYKTIKNNYGRPDEVIAAETLANYVRCNNSFVQAVFQAQFRSSLTCPRCHKQSNTFDPFHCISVQLPQLSQQTIFVTVLYITQHPRQVKLGLTVPPGSPIIALREQLHADTGIPVNRMVLVDVNDDGFSRVFCDSQPISTLEGVTSLYCVEIPEIKDDVTSTLTLLIANVKKDQDKKSTSRFGTPFVVQVNHDCTYVELQKKLLKEMSAVLKPEVFAYKTPLSVMFQIRLQDPSADPDTYIEQVEHPLLTEIIDMALSVLSSDAGPPHVKLLLEWTNPEDYFADFSDSIIEHESVSLLRDNNANQQCLTLEQCLEHYTKAETLSAEDAWRCPNCQQYLPVVKTLGLWSLPDILVIHFKRFRQQHEKGPDTAKLTTMVKFPLNAFDMSPHLARGSNSTHSLDNDEGSRNTGSPWRKFREHSKHNKYKSIKDNRYDLYAVCYHQGDTLETGHYTAACKNPYDHQWYKFDDHRVAHVPPDEVQEQIVNNEAYILFYQRRKFDASECSGTSSTSGDHWVSRIAPPSLPNGCSSSCSNSGLINVDAISKSTEKIDEQTTVPDQKPKEDLTLEDIKVIDRPLEDTVLIEKTDESEIVDVEAIEFADNDCTKSGNEIIFSRTSTPVKNLELQRPVSDLPTTKTESDTETITTQTKPIPIEPNNKTRPLSNNIEYSPKPLWPAKLQRDGNDLHFQDSLSGTLRNRHDIHATCQPTTVRHSFSTTSSCKIKECDALSMLRNAGSSCSKDTLLYIDQQSHSLIDDDDSFLGSRSLWISPVTPHKLITVSPKN